MRVLSHRRAFCLRKIPNFGQKMETCIKIRRRSVTICEIPQKKQKYQEKKLNFTCSGEKKTENKSGRKEKNARKPKWNLWGGDTLRQGIDWVGRQHHPCLGSPSSITARTAVEQYHCLPRIVKTIIAAFEQHNHCLE